jgi:Uma2 family endonuclease
MGNLATPEALIARWEEVCRDPSLQDLPYKIELNAWGKIELSPRTNRRGRLVAALAYEFHSQLPGGEVLISCGVLTNAGVRVPDVVWASAKLMAMHDEDAMLFQRAPEICVEVTTPDGEDKMPAYLVAGAKEVWLVSEEGSIRYFGASGEKAKSDFPVVVTLPPPMKGNP